MEEHVYMESLVVGNNIPLNRSNMQPISHRENYNEKKATPKRCLFFSIGIVFGSVVSGIIAFLVLKYNGIMLSRNESSCLWTEWTEWTGCNSLFPSVMDRRVQIYTGNAHNCQLKERFETRICKGRILDIRFDPTTVNSDCYLSHDNTTLSNRYTDHTPYKPYARSRFQNYKGAMVNKCVEDSTSIYFEIYFRYVISSELRGTLLVLELGIGERDEIDNSRANGNTQGWYFYLANSVGSRGILLNTRPERELIGKFVRAFSSNTAGTIVNGKFGILIDRERSKFSLFYNDTLLYTFHDVLSNMSLCPVFGVFNPSLVQVDLQVVSVGNFSCH